MFSTHVLVADGIPTAPRGVFGSITIALVVDLVDGCIDNFGW
jgi:hypothetical protein